LSLAIRQPLKGSDERLLDPEDGIGVQIPVVAYKSMRHQLLVAGGGYQVMHMRWPIRMAAELTQHLTYWAVVGNRIRDRFDADEGITALGIGDEDTAIVPPGLDIGLLNVVIAIGIVRPYVDSSALDRIAVKVDDFTLEETALPLSVETDILTHFADGGIFNMEGPEYSSLSSALGAPVVDRVDQYGKSKDVGEQNELLPLGTADLAGPSQEIDAETPFLLRELNFLSKGVKMFDQRSHHFSEPGIRGGAHAGVDSLNRTLFRKISFHSLPPRMGLPVGTAFI